MNPLSKKVRDSKKINDGSRSSLTDSSFESRRTSFSGSSTSFSASEEAKSEESSSPAPLGWPILKATLSNSKQLNSDDKVKDNKHKSNLEPTKFTNIDFKISETDVDTMMKERFAKLLLGEDMSGSGKGVCTALAISNAITNLCATAFGQLWRLEPLPCKKKEIWRREIELLVSVSDHIVELIPSWQTFPDGKKLEVMTCNPRTDICTNLPALRKLDNMLLEILDSFKGTEFWYVEQGIVAAGADADGSGSFRKAIQRQEEKWWLPVPRVPPEGLSENSRKQLNHSRESASQILKAAMSINSIALSEMEVPESYLESLPKNGRTCLGDFIYRYITSDHLSAVCLLDCLDLSSEHVVLEIANRIEAAIYVWRRRAHHKSSPNPNRSTTKYSWGIVKDFIDGDRRELLADRAENVLNSLKHQFPGLTQTTLDTCKIQSNKDVGKSILESYSRVLESIAFNILARIDDLLYVDDLTKNSDKFESTSVSMVSQKISHQFSVTISGTPHKAASGTPKFSPVPLISPARGEITPFLQNNNNNNYNNKNKNKAHRRGLGVRRVLSNYLGVETKTKTCSNPTEVNCSNLNSKKMEHTEQRPKETRVVENRTK